MFLQPPIKGSLGFFEETNILRESSLTGRVQCQSLRDRVEGRRNGDGNFLTTELGAVLRETGIPDFAQVFQQQG
jgi:hypothetical protein